MSERTLHTADLLTAADNIAQQIEDHPEFRTVEFWMMVDTALRDRGLSFCLEQRGIHGTAMSVMEG